MAEDLATELEQTIAFGVRLAKLALAEQGKKFTTGVGPPVDPSKVVAIVERLDKLAERMAARKAKARAP